MFFSGDPSTRKRVDLGGRSSKERDRQKLLEQTRLERNRRFWQRQQNSAALKIQVFFLFPFVFIFVDCGGLVFEVLESYCFGLIAFFQLVKNFSFYFSSFFGSFCLVNWGREKPSWREFKFAR